MSPSGLASRRSKSMNAPTMSVGTGVIRCTRTHPSSDPSHNPSHKFGRIQPYRVKPAGPVSEYMQVSGLTLTQWTPWVALEKPRGASLRGFESPSLRWSERFLESGVVPKIGSPHNLAIISPNGVGYALVRKHPRIRSEPVASPGLLGLRAGHRRVPVRPSNGHRQQVSRPEGIRPAGSRGPPRSPARQAGHSLGPP